MESAGTTTAETPTQAGVTNARGKPDPNVVLPPAVKKAAERANELAEQAKAVRDANPVADEPLKIAPPPPPNGSSGVAVTSYNPSNPAPPATPAPDLEHQLRSLKGRYEREQENNKRMAQQIADMQHLVTTLSSAPPAPQGGSGVRFEGPTSGSKRYVTQQEISEYGEELIDVMGRRAREVYEPLLDQMNNELSSLRRQVGGVRDSQSYNASVKMYDILAQEVPNWDAINHSAEFAGWLEQPDPMTGVKRLDILKYAHGRNQTAQVVAVFKGFLNDLASTGPAYNRAAPGNGAGGYSPSNGAASTPQSDLMQYVAPGRAKSGQTSVPPEKPYFNATDINKFYRDKTAGHYAGREAEMNAIEAELFAAGREGRIRR